MQYTDDELKAMEKHKAECLERWRLARRLLSMRREIRREVRDEWVRERGEEWGALFDAEVQRQCMAQKKRS